MQQYRAALDRALASLAGYPEAGKRQDHLFPGCRVRTVEHHLRYYQIGRTEVEVVRSLHERADAARHLGTRRC